MRLGRLAATGLLAGAIVAFAIALLVPRRRPLLDPADTPDLADVAVSRPRQVDVTAAERTTGAARIE